MKRKIFTLMTFLFLAIVFIFTGEYTEAAVSGDFEYIVQDDDTAKITGYNGEGETVVIPEVLDEYEVSAIKDYSFSSCETLKEVTISKNISEIGKDVFAYHENLQKIHVVDENAYFSDIDGILYNKDQTILLFCPRGKQGNIDSIPNTVLEVGRSAFSDCENITAIKLPESITKINKFAFSDCINVKNIVLPEKITEIGDFAFSYTGITSFKIPKNVSKIGETIFFTCYSLQTIDVDANNTNFSSLNGILYDKDKTTLLCCPSGKSGMVKDIPSTVVKIGEYGFSYCKKLTGIDFPENLQRIEEGGVIGCVGLTEMIVPKSVNYIGYGAFAWCDGLKKITIYNDKAYFFEDEYGAGTYTLPDNATVYGYNGSSAQTYAKNYERQFVALDGNKTPGGSTNNITTTQPPSANNPSSNGNAPTTNNPPASVGQNSQTGNMPNVSIVGTVLTDRSSKASYTVTSTNGTVAYKGTTNKKAKSVSIPTTVTSGGVTYKVTSIASGALKNNKTITKVTIGSNITSIGKQAFSGCKKLKTITIKTKNLTAKSVGAKAFAKAGSSNYKKLTVKVPKSKKTLYKKILKKKGLSSKVKIK